MTSPRRKQIKWRKWISRHPDRYLEKFHRLVQNRATNLRDAFECYFTDLWSTEPANVSKGPDAPTLNKILGMVHEVVTSEPSPYTELSPGVFGVVEDPDKYEARYVGSVEYCHPDTEAFLKRIQISDKP